MQHDAKTFNQLRPRTRARLKAHQVYDTRRSRVFPRACTHKIHTHTQHTKNRSHRITAAASVHLFVIIKTECAEKARAHPAPDMAIRLGAARAQPPTSIYTHANTRTQITHTMFNKFINDEEARPGGKIYWDPLCVCSSATSTHTSTRKHTTTDTKTHTQPSTPNRPPHTL